MSTAVEKQMPASGFTSDAWVRAIICHPEVKRSAENIAWLLSSDTAFTTEGCTASDTDIAGQLDLARNSVKNGLLLLRAHGFIRWSWNSIDGARIRTIRPVFVLEATAPIGPVLHRGDASAPAAGAALSPAKVALPRRVRRSGSDGVVPPMPEPLADQEPIPASAVANALDIAFEMPARTQPGCNTDPVLWGPAINEHAPDAIRVGKLLDMPSDPAVSNGTRAMQDFR